MWGSIVFRYRLPSCSIIPKVTIAAATIPTARDGTAIRLASSSKFLVGFNAPETRRAACDAERELGAKATRRLRDLVRAGDLDFVYVTCSCPPGTEGTPVCNYGRDCGTLKCRGRDVGTVLMEEGLAVPFVCATRCPKTPRPWC